MAVKGSGAMTSGMAYLLIEIAGLTGDVGLADRCCCCQ